MTHHRHSALALHFAAVLAFANSALSSAIPFAAAQQDDVRAAEQRRVETFARAAKSVVCVFSSADRGGGGSGVVISPDGYGLTNFHVVQEFVRTRRGFGGLSDGKMYPLKVIGIDAGGDIALFKLEGRDQWDFAELADSDQLRVGEWVAAMGNPFLVAEDLQPTMTLGIVSGVHRYQEGQGNLLEYADCIQVSTSINPGNSGGPLFDMQGRVVGINGRGSFEERGRVNVGLGYAVSANQIKRFLPGLRAGRQVDHGTLGATVRVVGSSVIVGQIQDFSPAEKAGLQLADELVTIAGRPIHTENDFINIVVSHPAGWPLAIRYRREGRESDTVARLERLSLKVPLVYLPDPDVVALRVRELLDRLRASIGLMGEPPDEITWAVDLPESADVPAPAKWRHRFDDPSDDLARAAPLTGKDRAMAELRTMVRALLIAPPKSLQWSHLGGDEVDGRIAEVLELRLDAGRRVRFKLDSETSSPCEVEFASGEAVDATWSATGVETILGAWPRNWQVRYGPGESRTVIFLSALISPDPPTAPASAPIADQPSIGVADLDRPPGGPVAAAIAIARQRVVKLFGGQFARSHGYGSGVLVSSDGRIVTVLSSMLEDAQLRAVLPDGRRLPARVVRRDATRQLAELRVEADDLSFYELGGSEHLQAGDWVVAAANPFKVAVGPEPVSASIGVLSGRASLQARRYAQEFPYQGPVLWVDVLVSSPGSAGGALVDVDGRFVGLIGRAVESRLTNTFANYALPVEEVAAFLAGQTSGDEPQVAELTDPASRPAVAIDLGIRLFEIGGRSRPAYVERVRPGSAAHAAAVRAGDLILSVAGVAVQDCDDYNSALTKLAAGQSVTLVLKRRDEILTVDLTAAERRP